MAVVRKWSGAVGTLAALKFTFLRAPIGTPEFVCAELKKVEEKASLKITQSLYLPEDHPALAALKVCGGSSNVNYHMRLCGEAPCWRDFDSTLLSAIQLRLGPLSPLARTQLTLPHRLGGLGFRAASPYAEIAHKASLTESKHFIKTTFPVLHALIALPDDPTLNSTTTPSTQQRKIQKSLSFELDQKRFAALQHSLDSRDLARFRSLSCKHALAWLVPPRPSRTSWLNNHQLKATLRYFLGLEVQRAALPCITCRGADTADTLGTHSVTCMEGGEHSRVHDTIRNTLNGFFASALWRPLQEVNCFDFHPGLRADIYIGAGTLEKSAVDVAWVNPLSRSNVKDAAETPAGAAEKYAHIKTAKYKDAFDASVRLSAFRPIVFDALGAPSRGFYPLLNALSIDIHNNDPSHTMKSVARLVASRIGLIIARGVAAAILRNTAVACA